MTRLPAAVALLTGAWLCGQQVHIEPRARPGPSQPMERPTLRVDTNLVLIPVSVSDELNRLVTGLEKEHFRLYDDDAEQKITQFAMEDAPVAVGLVFDTSGSMGEKLKRSRAAAGEFFRTSDPEDEFFLVEFDDNARLAVPLTSDVRRIEAHLMSSRPKGSTALLDGIYLALSEMRKSRKTRKALLVISDGGDNHSRYSNIEVTRVIQESDVLVYAIGVFGGAGTPEEYAGPGMLRRIAEQTGGRMFVSNAEELPDMAQKIAIDLRNRYLLGYSPTNQARDGKWHRVSVRLAPPRGMPKLRAVWRLGYFAPGE